VTEFDPTAGGPPAGRQADGGAPAAAPHGSGPTFRVTGRVLAAPARTQGAPVGARLCGGTSTCIALIRVDSDPR